MKASIAIKILALLTAAGAAAFLAFVLGFDRKELTAIGNFLREGLVTARIMALHAVDRGARLIGRLRRRLAGRKLAQEVRRRRQLLDFTDANVVGIERAGHRHGTSFFIQKDSV